jgi:hypothetical protein
MSARRATSFRARRARERGQRRRALERARRAVLRARQVRVEVGEVHRALRPNERVHALKLEASERGLEARCQGVVVWRGGRRS